MEKAIGPNDQQSIMGENVQVFLGTVQPIQKDSKVTHNQEAQLVERMKTGIRVGKGNVKQAQKREKGTSRMEDDNSKSLERKCLTSSEESQVQEKRREV